MAKNGWNEWIFRSIDWDAQAQSLKVLQRNEGLFVIKWAHDLLPTRRCAQRIGKAESDLGPSGLATIDTAPRVLACPLRVPWQTTFLDSLSKLLAALCTQPDPQRTLVAAV